MIAKHPTLLPSLNPTNHKKKLIGIPRLVSTEILLSKLATHYVFICFSVLRDPTRRREIHLVKNQACSTYTALLPHLLLLKKESTIKKKKIPWGSVQGQAFFCC